MSLLSGRINFPMWSYHCQKAGYITPLGVVCCLLTVSSTHKGSFAATLGISALSYGHTQSNIVIIALTPTRAQELSTTGISYLLPFSSEQGGQVRPQWFLLAWKYPKQMLVLGDNVCWVILNTGNYLTVTKRCCREALELRLGRFFDTGLFKVTQLWVSASFFLYFKIKQ